MGTGNTAAITSFSVVSPVHPRGHGEHFTTSTRRVSCVGSSPWARGTHLETAHTAIKSRFIPVGTGNTLAKTAFLISSAVHPRGHGEHVSRLCICQMHHGSSPWARGTLDIRKAVESQLRFIPVGTGNTMMNTPRIWIITVHPRGHGEHRKGSFSKRTLFGSSPWARGTHSWTGGRLSNSRFIPVGTGNTFVARERLKPSSVHPRGHGEH